MRFVATTRTASEYAKGTLWHCSKNFPTLKNDSCSLVDDRALVSAAERWWYTKVWCGIFDTFVRARCVKNVATQEANDVSKVLFYHFTSA